MPSAGWALVELVKDRSDRSRAARLAHYGSVSTHLALLSDQQLGELLDQASPIGSGIGGTSVMVGIEGLPIFVKKVPLTDLERRPEHVMSTANLFRLPTFYQYGIGSAGLGAWRELAVHVMTTNWVLGDNYQGFPLMFHWRVLPTLPERQSAPREREEVENTVSYWEGSSAVRKRIEAIKRSSASIVLFLEHIPQTLSQWLSTRVAEGDEAIDSACITVERGLIVGTSFMKPRGLLHFDAHFENILTDGQRLYFADFGLAMSSRFETSKVESAFFARHLNYDRCYVLTRLVDWMITTLAGPADRDALVRDFAEGGNPVHLPESVAATVERYAGVAVLMNKFARELQTHSRTVPYPVDELERAWPRPTFPSPDVENPGSAVTSG